MALLTKWRNINLSHEAPFIYLRYCKSYSSLSGLVIKSKFYLNEEYASGEVFFEKIQEGFGMLAMEIKAKQNTHYYVMPRNKTDLYSVNFFSGSKKIGYKNGSDIYWSDNHVLSFDPGTSHEIYLEADTILKCSRLIYTDTFLSALTDTDQNVSSAIISIFKNLGNRRAVKAELFLQNRLFNILRYERDQAHYRASLFSAVYGLTTSFIKLSAIKKDTVNNDSKTRNVYIMSKAVMILESHLSEGFPGILKLASECNISVSKLKRDFKATFGITPLNYFRNLQINYATTSFNGREKTVKQIANELGFKKSSTFSTWYKKLNNHQHGMANEL